MDGSTAGFINSRTTAALSAQLQAGKGHRADVGTPQGSAPYQAAPFEPSRAGTTAGQRQIAPSPALDAGGQRLGAAADVDAPRSAYTVGVDEPAIGAYLRHVVPGLAAGPDLPLSLDRRSLQAAGLTDYEISKLHRALAAHAVAFDQLLARENAHLRDMLRQHAGDKLPGAVEQGLDGTYPRVASDSMTAADAWSKQGQGQSDVSSEHDTPGSSREGGRLQAAGMAGQQVPRPAGEVGDMGMMQQMMAECYDSYNAMREQLEIKLRHETAKAENFKVRLDAGREQLSQAESAAESLRRNNALLQIQLEDALCKLEAQSTANDAAHSQLQNINSQASQQQVKAEEELRAQQLVAQHRIEVLEQELRNQAELAASFQNNRAQVEVLQAQLTAVQEQHAEASRHVDSLREALKETRGDKEALSEVGAAARARADAAEGLAAARELQRQRLKDQLELCEQRSAGRAEELCRARLLLERCRTSQTELRAEATALITKLNTTCKEQSAQLDELRSQTRELTESLNFKQQEVTSMGSQLQASRTHIKQLLVDLEGEQQKAVKAAEKMERTEKLLEVANDEREVTNTKLHSAQLKVDQLNEVNMSLSNKVDELKATLQERNVELSTTREQLEAQRRSCSALSAQVEHVQQRCDELAGASAELEAAREEQRATREQLMELTKEQQAWARLGGVAGVEARLQQESTRAQALESERAELSVQLTAAKRSNSTLRDQLAASQKETSQLQIELEGLSTQLAHSNATIAVVKQELEEARRQGQYSSANVEELSEEIAELQQQLDASMADRQELAAQRDMYMTSFQKTYAQLEELMSQQGQQRSVLLQHHEQLQLTFSKLTTQLDEQIARSGSPVGGGSRRSAAASPAGRTTPIDLSPVKRVAVQTSKHLAAVHNMLKKDADSAEKNWASALQRIRDKMAERKSKAQASWYTTLTAIGALRSSLDEPPPATLSRLGSMAFSESDLRDGYLNGGDPAVDAASGYADGNAEGDEPAGADADGAEPEVLPYEEAGPWPVPRQPSADSGGQARDAEGAATDGWSRPATSSSARSSLLSRASVAQQPAERQDQEQQPPPSPTRQQQRPTQRPGQKPSTNLSLSRVRRGPQQQQQQQQQQQLPPLPQHQQLDEIDEQPEDEREDDDDAAAGSLTTRSAPAHDDNGNNGTQGSDRSEHELQHRYSRRHTQTAEHLEPSSPSTPGKQKRGAQRSPTFTVATSSPHGSSRSPGGNSNVLAAADGSRPGSSTSRASTPGSSSRAATSRLEARVPPIAANAPVVLASMVVPRPSSRPFPSPRAANSNAATPRLPSFGQQPPPALSMSSPRSARSATEREAPTPRHSAAARAAAADLPPIGSGDRSAAGQTSPHAAGSGDAAGATRTRRGAGASPAVVDSASSPVPHAQVPTSGGEGDGASHAPSGADAPPPMLQRHAPDDVSSSNPAAAHGAGGSDPPSGGAAGPALLSGTSNASTLSGGAAAGSAAHLNSMLHRDRSATVFAVSSRSSSLAPSPLPPRMSVGGQSARMSVGGQSMRSNSGIPMPGLASMISLEHYESQMRKVGELHSQLGQLVSQVRDAQVSAATSQQLLEQERQAAAEEAAALQRTISGLNNELTDLREEHVRLKQGHMATVSEVMSQGKLRDKYVAELYKRLADVEWRLKIAKEREATWGHTNMVPLGRTDRGIQTQYSEIWAQDQQAVQLGPNQRSTAITTTLKSLAPRSSDAPPGALASCTSSPAPALISKSGAKGQQQVARRNAANAATAAAAAPSRAASATAAGADGFDEERQWDWAADVDALARGATALSEAQTLRVISDIYTKKVTADSSAARQHQPAWTLRQFLAHYFMQRHRRARAAAEGGLAQLLAGLRRHGKHSREVANFSAALHLTFTSSPAGSDQGDADDAGYDVEEGDDDDWFDITTLPGRDSLPLQRSSGATGVSSSNHSKRTSGASARDSRNASDGFPLQPQDLDADGQPAAYSRRTSSSVDTPEPPHTASVRQAMTPLDSTNISPAPSPWPQGAGDQSWLALKMDGLKLKPRLDAELLMPPTCTTHFEALLCQPGADTVLRAMANAAFLQYMREEDLGRPLSEVEAPHVHFLLTEALEILGLAGPPPPLYIRDGARPEVLFLRTPRAFATPPSAASGRSGSSQGPARYAWGRQAVLVLNSAMLELLQPREIQAAMAAALAGIVVNHGAGADAAKEAEGATAAARCRATVADLLTLMSLMVLKPSAVLQSLPRETEIMWDVLSKHFWAVGRLLSLCGDRAAQVVAQDLQLVITTMAKLTATTYDDAEHAAGQLLAQSISNTPDMALLYQQLTRSTAAGADKLLLLRVQELHSWCGTPAYQSMMCGATPLRVVLPASAPSTKTPSPQNNKHAQLGI